MLHAGLAVRGAELLRDGNAVDIVAERAHRPDDGVGVARQVPMRLRRAHLDFNLKLFARHPQVCGHRAELGRVELDLERMNRRVASIIDRLRDIDRRRNETLDPGILRNRGYEGSRRDARRRRSDGSRACLGADDRHFSGCGIGKARDGLTAGFLPPRSGILAPSRKEPWTNRLLRGSIAISGCEALGSDPVSRSRCIALHSVRCTSRVGYGGTGLPVAALGGGIFRRHAGGSRHHR